MRVNSSSNMKKSAVRIAVAALLASTVAGCSSDATRFSGLFPSHDNLTTASIPQRQGLGAYGRAPVPTEDVGTAAAPDYASRNAAMSQPYPAASSGGYAAPAAVSPARSAAAPVSVQRAALSAPAPASGLDPQSRSEAMAQPMPAALPPQTAAVQRPSRVDADKVVTGSAGASGWSTSNAPKVTLRPGETAATLSRRYGVPEAEILRANGGKLTPGQIAVIPTYASGNKARSAAGSVDLSRSGDAPQPLRPQEDKVAMLPKPALRDREQADAAKAVPSAGGTPKPDGAGTYTVKAGDTLTRIARATNTPIDQLKAANNLEGGALRIGQTLRVGSAAGEPLKTASIPKTQPAAPAAPAAPAKMETVAAKPNQPTATEKPAAQTASLSEVEKKSDVNVAAPTATGIDKYRWPATGAVIASYGQNVNGSRNDGIDISVPEGTPIKAAENGVVIYAGNGLKQLGNTVLVRHDDGKVTVYGHASNISVTRGQKVQRGQTIATSGMSGDAKRPQVHFEVRKDATPVNPMTFLE
ncbi:peptidoglycan DD-metalloendopeptidase family protein [Rhizobium sp. SSA_523]|uniref:peptidoglycan DD-metalloendopeptidase family protein n=1 Tax=Rhizobium sp. SSA_523 TaxID=2952477 RepID=UPI0020910AD4|nr:peptidoglycan DD-metalloendopeptidase family protein [Rhizobium sp. SSA_523]MCO5734054.1 peptidoglycan DD-metalloendopeptidase family protein [Rhizobium sp. SSA_523]WKC24692.1 peptidoglycan DD-metalloendopeptidase family protein [Rhizobium sp. SSA_523]